MTPSCDRDEILTRRAIPRLQRADLVFDRLERRPVRVARRDVLAPPQLGLERACVLLDRRAQHAPPRLGQAREAALRVGLDLLLEELDRLAMAER